MLDRDGAHACMQLQGAVMSIQATALITSDPYHWVYPNEGRLCLQSCQRRDGFGLCGSSVLSGSRAPDLGNK